MLADLSRSVLILAVGGLLGCGPTTSSADGDGGVPDGGGSCADGAKQCDPTNKLMICQGGRWVSVQQCPKGCDPVVGCVQCVPTCAGNDVSGCNPDGTPAGIIAHCETCQNGHCTDACGQAQENQSYLGCDYWPTVTMNPEIPTSFSFAVAVANASSSGNPAAVTITGGGLATPVTATVQAGQLSTITLPWVEELRSPPNKASILKANGADGFGIAVYGVGSYTSYMYPGGLDVKQINVPG
jgi:hypothetical protein